MGRFNYNLPPTMVDNKNMCRVKTDATRAAEDVILSLTSDGNTLLEIVMGGISHELDATIEANQFTPQDPHLYVLFDVAPRYKGREIAFVLGVQVTRTFGRTYNTTDIHGMLMTVQEGRRKASEIKRHAPYSITYDGKMS
jgi:hypothetical protein